MGKLFLTAGAVLLVIDLLAAAGFTVWLLGYRKKVKKMLDDIYQ